MQLYTLSEESKLVISWSEGPLVLLCCGVNRLIGSLSRVAHFIAVRQCERVICEYLTSLAWDLLLRFFFFFLKKTSVALRRSWVAEDFTHWDHSTQDIISSFMALTNEAEPWQTLDLPRHGAVRACPWFSMASVAGSVRRGRGWDQYSQRRSEGGWWGSGHPRLSKGG